MTTIYLFCALVGGTILVCQFVLTLVGLGDGGGDVPDDLPDGADVEMAEADLDAGDTDASSASTWLFGVISFRTLVAAAAFFGVTGMAAATGGLSVPSQLLVATSSGVAAMYGMHWLMLTFYRLGQSGTLQVRNAIGKTGTVYIPIPVAGRGQGKVQVKVQDRLEEFAAVTSGDAPLATGARVVVVGVLSGNTLEVRPLHETEPKPVEATA